MFKIYKISLLFSLFFLSEIVFSQEKTVGVMGKVVRQTNNGVTTENIHLRFGPRGIEGEGNPAYYGDSWERFRLYGYKLERFTGNSSTPDFTINILPDKIQLKKIGDDTTSNNDVRKRLLQKSCEALYASMYEQVDQAQMRSMRSNFNLRISSDGRDLKFIAGMVAADMSFRASMFAGLGFIDESAKNGISYRYKVTELAPAQGGYIPFDEITVLKQYETLPPVKAPNLKFGNKNVMLSWRWNDPNSTDKYSNYWVKRTDAIGKAEIITPDPIMSLGSEVEGQQIAKDSLYHGDILPVNRVPYTYRLIARTIFDEETESSENSGKGYEEPAYLPRIESADLDFSSNVILKWKFPSDTTFVGSQDLIQGYKIYKAPMDSLELYQQIPINGNTTTLLPPSTTSYQVSGITQTTYFRVAAIWRDRGETLFSAAFLVQPVDSVVNRPTNLKAVFGSAGKVSLNWIAPIDNDILGYKVFRKNTLDPKEEPSEITTEITPNLSFEDDMLKGNDVLSDSTKYKLGNRNYVYYVAAVDKRYNQSKLSEPAIAKKPDDIKPTQPIITKFDAVDNSVLLNYRRSLDEDILSHKLIRYELPSKTESLLSTDTKKDSTIESYTDSGVEFGKTYAYLVMARDSAGNETLSNLITITIGKNTNRPMVENFSLAYDNSKKQIKLSWAYKLFEDLIEYEVFKTEDTDITKDSLSTNPALWKIIEKNTFSVLDEAITYNTKYQYMIRAVFKDGTTSQFSSASISIPDPKICQYIAWLVLKSLMMPISDEIIQACEEIKLEDGFDAVPQKTGSVELIIKN